MIEVEWRCYLRPAKESAPSTHLGVVMAATKDEALERASCLWPNIRIDVISKPSWDLMGVRDRQAFTGTLRVPSSDPRFVSADWKVARCHQCGGDIHYTKTDNVWRNPPKWCETCVPIHIRRIRANRARRRADAQRLNRETTDDTP